MQIYTKILIGMAVGAALGLTLGPTSTMLTPDLFKIEDASRITLESEPNGARLELPSCTGGKKGCIQLRLMVLDQLMGEVADKAGTKYAVPTHTKVEFEVTRKLALVMGDLTPLGVKAAGETATAWLVMKNTALDAGVLTTPIPISDTGDRIISAISPIGKLFMRLISMVIVPLVFSSLLVGIASLGDIRKLGRMGGRTLGVYLLTTAVAVTIGLMCAHIVQPGGFVAEEDKAALTSKFDSAAGEKSKAAASAPSAIDNVLNIVPKNPVESLSTGNMLQTIFFAVIFGIALTMMGATESQIVVTFFDKVQQAMVVIIHIVMGIAPYGVAALIAEVVGTSGLSVLGALLVYALTVMLGLILHAILVYGGLVRVFTSIKVKEFLNAIRPAQLVAFSTSSSSATLPVSMEVAEQNLRVSNPVASFVLPLGSTVNMDGTALYQGVAAVFIAQVFGIDLSIADQLGIVLTATMASVGAAGVPGAGMVTLAMVLTSTGIPAVGVALILG
ncbi:MAG: dicarboxylate/amino acid:cation symporter, partial [Myxococcota bacterium]|nr:dicarboxylate/amino acid:cation symporter [Myxococcota bacterium]